MKVFYVLASLFIFINNGVFSTVVNVGNTTTTSNELTNYNLKGSGFKSKLTDYLSSLPNYLKRKLLTKGKGSCSEGYNEPCILAEGPIGSNSCNHQQACYNSQGSIGNGSCNKIWACHGVSFWNWNVGNSSCNTDNACNCRYPKGGVEVKDGHKNVARDVGDKGGVEVKDGHKNVARDVGDNECNTPDECCKPYFLISEDELRALLLENTIPIFYSANHTDPNTDHQEIPSNNIVCSFKRHIKTCVAIDDNPPFNNLTVVA